MFAELLTPEQITILTQIIFIDLVLAGDNAIIIGMVASKFPPKQRKKVIFWGISGAVLLRIILNHPLKAEEDHTVPQHSDLFVVASRP